MMLRSESFLRTAVLGYRIQPASVTYCTHHTVVPAKRQAEDSSATIPRIVKRYSPLQQPKSIVRHSSTFSDSTSPTSTSSSTSSFSPSATTPTITWNKFFTLRKSRRRLQLGASIGTGLAGMIGGAQTIAMSDMDAIVAQIPLDPFITLGLITFSCGGVGWLLGPIIGSGIFKILNRSAVKEMAMKEKEFYARVKRYRVDPSASSMANPVPDYYGEKISSVQGYRQWLKDQRAFNKKRQTFVA